MSWWKTLWDHLLYKPPRPSAVEFEPGIEDRVRGEAGESDAKRESVESGRAEQPGTQEGTTGGDTGRRAGTGGHVETAIEEKDLLEEAQSGRSSRRYRDRNGRRKRQRNTVVQEKYSHTVRENREVDRILSEKIELSYRLEENKKVLEKIFRVPENKDAVFRKFTIGTEPPVKAMLVFIDGVVNAQIQNLAVLQPLMLLTGARDVRAESRPVNSGGTSRYRDFFERVEHAVLPNNQVAVAKTYQQVVNDVLNGNSALFIEGYNQALLLETKGWKFRNVSPPQVEAVIRGPQEAFTEMLRINTSLVRRIIHRPSLVTEFIKVGGAGPMQVAVMYMADLANPDLIKEVKRRLESIRADIIQETGLLEQMIEDNPYHMVPQILTTERPDRVAMGLLEGKVAILVDGNPFVMVVPCTFFTMMQAPEDAYVRWPFGSFVRVVRYAGLFLALLLPAHYVAIVAYHQEFIPTDLLLALTGNREKVPFPSLVEILIMEASFELIREAGIRIPGTIGTMLGIVGALILGQAAVAANIVSPILIIVVAVTALGSFAIPNYSFSLSIRLLRFAYVLFASVSGLLGILVGFFVHVGVASTVKSFGVPFLAPAAPVTRKGHDYFMRGPVWEQETRPDYIDPLKKRRQPGYSRGWVSPGGEESGEKGK